MATGDLSTSQARRIALYAQGFGRRRPSGRIDRRHLRTVLDHVGLIQIDSVNVLVRSQEMPLFARLGAHPRSLIPDATAVGELFEYWVHEACHVPVGQHPLYRWQMDKMHRWKGVRGLRERRPDFIDDVLRRIRDDGAIVAGDLKQRTGAKGQWWDWDDGKTALEYLFHTGAVTATRRSNDFARVYDLTERVIPSAVLDLPTPSETDARKELIVLAAKYHGIGTANDLMDYHRLNRPATRPLIAELVEEGRLVETSVAGWSEVALMHPDAYLPRWIRARTVLSPFDPVVWTRDRAERLFGFRYRIEIYVPKPKRVYGYYVLPFLLGDAIVARVDLKADRESGRLLVQGAFGEPGTAADEVAVELRAELDELATWLGLAAGVHIVPHGDLAPALLAT
jgi:uncharacterized protein YcaQ